MLVNTVQHQYASCQSITGMLRTITWRSRCCFSAIGDAKLNCAECAMSVVFGVSLQPMSKKADRVYQATDLLQSYLLPIFIQVPALLHSTLQLQLNVYRQPLPRHLGIRNGNASKSYIISVTDDLRMSSSCLTMCLTDTVVRFATV